MKKNILSVLAICAALFGCQKNEISETLSSGGDLHATIEDVSSTKTYMDADNNIRWSENDQIVAFMKTSYGHKYQIKPSFAGKTYADFSKISSAVGDDLSAGVEWDYNVAYYPYDESVECVKSGDNYTLDATLPTEQTYLPGSFGAGSFPMVAVSEDRDITFKNICGGVKLQLKGTQNVTSLKFEGKNTEKLSGAATVIAYTNPDLNPAITMDASALTSVILNCGPVGVQLNEANPTEFIIALPPVLFSKGFRVIVTDDVGKTYILETDKANTVLRSSLLVMPALSLGESSEQVGDDDAAMIIRVRANFDNDFTCYLPIITNDDEYMVDCYVDWGDGTIDHIINGYGLVEHTYNGILTGASFDVKITGVLERMGRYNFDGKTGITDIIQWGHTGLKNLDYAFNKNIMLETIASDKTGSLSSVKSMGCAFRNCSNLKYVPEDLFSKCNELTDVRHCFSGCASLVSIPSNLFSNCPNVSGIVSFYECFSGCASLVSIPSNLFSSCDGLRGAAFGWCFANCSSLKSIPADLFSNCPSVSLVETFEYCFSGCSSLVTLPSKLFADCSSVYDFRNCFENCSSLSSVPFDLFSGCVKAMMFTSCFQNCSSLISVPSELFSSSPEAYHFTYCFSNCTSLTEVPVSIFDNNRKAEYLVQTFYNCKSMKGESPYTEINGVKYHLYERSNAPDYFKSPKSYDACFNKCSKLSDYMSMPSEWKSALK